MNSFVHYGAALCALCGCLGSQVDGETSGSSAPACIAWRQTTTCQAASPRAPCYDSSCSEIIPSGYSGYCECGSARVALDCGHAPITCAQACGTSAAPQSDCVAWRQTGMSLASGAREPSNDRGCDVLIPAGFSGFCECGNRTVPFDTGHAPFTCAAVCAGAEVFRGPGCGNVGSGGGGGGGCHANSDCGRCERCELSTGRCLSRLSC